MTIEEARKVAAVCAGAHGGCAGCVRALAEELQAQFPEYRWRQTERDPYMVEIVVEEEAG